AAPTGETSLQTLLSTLTTVLHPDTYVFVTLAPGAELPPLADVQLIFHESEGTTLVTTLQTAEARGWAVRVPVAHDHARRALEPRGRRFHGRRRHAARGQGYGRQPRQRLLPRPPVRAGGEGGRGGRGAGEVGVGVSGARGGVSTPMKNSDDLYGYYFVNVALRDPHPGLFRGMIRPRRPGRTKQCKKVASLGRFRHFLPSRQGLMPTWNAHLGANLTSRRV
ncbi:hypothetical protein CSHISOI_10062, partial [Colletotrichum shisoi]